MRNKSTYYKLPVQIDNIIEVRLCYATWNKIKLIAAMRNRSYSWVVRHAVFRTIKRKNANESIKGIKSIKLSKKFEALTKKTIERKKDSKNKHRHKLCLYGSDELYIRITAVQMGCTMTHLIRLALEYQMGQILLKTSFLSRIGASGRFTCASWYWLGIKLFHGGEFPIGKVFERQFKFTPYEKSEYW